MSDGLLKFGLCIFAVFGIAVSDPAHAQTKSDYFLSAKQAVLRGLRDPDSAKFGALSEGTGSSGLRTVCGEVNAKNGFGGYTGMAPFIYLIDWDDWVILDRREVSGTIQAQKLVNGLRIYETDCIR
jgi:hypothetical protein